MTSRGILEWKFPNRGARQIAGVAALVFALPLLALGSLYNPALAVGDHRKHKMTESEPEAAHHGVTAATQGMRGSAQVHTVHMAGESRTLTHHIVMQLLLAAHGIETAEKLENIRRAHEECDAILKGLRHGDKRLALTGTANPEVLDRLDKVDLLWARFGSQVTASLASGQVSAGQVKAVDKLAVPLLEAIDGMVSAFVHFAYGGETFSVLSRTISTAQRQSTLTHKMTKEYLLIAYGHEVERNQIRLAKTFATFDRILNGLVNGDPKLSVLAAPSPALQEQYAVVQRLWADFRPVIERAVKSGQADSSALDRITHRSKRLATELDEAVELYHRL